MHDANRAMRPSVADRHAARHAVVAGLARLRAAFPLEARLHGATAAIRHGYGQVLAHWLRACVPPLSLLDTGTLDVLHTLDAIVPTREGIGCYPFSTRPTGITVRLPAGAVSAMCAIDALAVARLAATPTIIEAACSICATPVTCRVQEDGGLEHDQAETARVLWKHSCATAGACSEALCRNLLFVCPACTVPPDSDCYTLPQATAIGNAFFAFQRSLLPAER